uniref:Cellular inhibitor of PP2A n=1 Tax=Myripristis murdjan TaxID=586833 RepID=A0A667YV63_9TELE
MGSAESPCRGSEHCTPEPQCPEGRPSRRVGCHEVSGLKCDQLLSSGQVLPSECVSGLVELAGDPNSIPALTSTIISLLAQLGRLHCVLSGCNQAARLLHQGWDDIVCVCVCLSQCLQLLQKLTYNTRTFHTTNYIHELVAFLVTNIQSQNDDIIMPCLGLMANLCRYNHSVQSHIKSLDNVKPFYRTLINFLAHNSLTVVVFTLSILASLTLNEKVGEKLFDAKNIHQTFQLVFNIIVNGDGTLTRKYSVDLLVDLLKSPKIADYLTRYEHFSACVSQVLGLLHSKDPDSAAKVLELLLALCSISGLRSLLCEVVFRPAGLKLRAGGRRQGAGLDKAEPGLALVQWLSSPVEGAESCSLQALQLLSELLEEALGADSVSASVLSFVEMLLPVLLGLLKGLNPAQGEAQLRKHCLRVTNVTNLLLDILHLSVPSCRGSEFEVVCLCFSQVCAEAVLKTLELMSKLRQQVKDMETSFYKILQDQRMVTPFSLALTSHCRERVQTGLALLFEATPLPDFPSLILGESIAANNAYRQREAELSVKRVAVQDVPTARTNISTLDSSTASSRSVHNLIEKLQTGLELQEQVEDLRVSEIIDVYEQKLSALASKESRLQDLLEAKALALSQADRLIAQYRFQRAQAEAEARKLGGLLKEAERRREELQGELGSQVLEVERSKADMEELLQHNARLQQDSQEHQALKGAYNSLLNRSEAAAARSATLKPVSRFDECLLSGLRVELQAEEQRTKEKDQERRELEETVDVLRKELNKTEQARKDASIRASSLELQKGQMEAKLRQKEEELNKHSAMIAMIHSLSSGKLKSDVNLSL